MLPAQGMGVESLTGLTQGALISLHSTNWKLALKHGSIRSSIFVHVDASTILKVPLAPMVASRYTLLR